MEQDLTPTEREQLADTLSRHLITEMSKPEPIPAHVSLYRLTAELCELQGFYEDAVAGIEYCEGMLAAKDVTMPWTDQLQSYQAEADAALGELVRYVQAQIAKVDPVVGFIRYCAAQQASLKAEEERLYRVRKTFERMEEGTKEAALLALRMINQKRFQGRFNTIRRQANSVASVVVEDDTKVPDEYYDVTVKMTCECWDQIKKTYLDGTYAESRCTVQETVLNRSRVKEAIEAGEEIEGARLVKGEHIRVS